MNSGIAGYPADFTSSLHLDHFLPECKPVKPLTKQVVIELMQKYSTNGVFGIKVPFVAYQDEIKSNTLLDIFPEKPKFIYTHRKDKLDQAISSLIAVQSGKYYSFQSAPLPSFQSYSKKNIDTFLNIINTQEEVWEKWFNANDIKPLRISYEELEADPSKTVGKVLQYLDIDVADFAMPSTKLRKQANEVNNEWKHRYESGE
jgi:LPS sulfotransferase NodH